jgi:hypothetical protein
MCSGQSAASFDIADSGECFLVWFHGHSGFFLPGTFWAAAVRILGRRPLVGNA